MTRLLLVEGRWLLVEQRRRLEDLLDPSVWRNLKTTGQKDKRDDKKYYNICTKSFVVKKSPGSKFNFRVMVKEGKAKLVG